MVLLLLVALGLAQLQWGAASELPADAGGVIGQLVGGGLSHVVGTVGANLFLFGLFFVALTLATGLSWFALMDRTGALVLWTGKVFARGARALLQWRQSRVQRDERIQVRRVETEKRAKREPAHIPPPPPPVGEKSDRSRREP